MTPALRRIAASDVSRIESLIYKPALCCESAQHVYGRSECGKAKGGRFYAKLASRIHWLHRWWFREFMYRRYRLDVAAGNCFTMYFPRSNTIPRSNPYSQESPVRLHDQIYRQDQISSTLSDFFMSRIPPTSTRWNLSRCSLSSPAYIEAYSIPTLTFRIPIFTYYC